MAALLVALSFLLARPATAADSASPPPPEPPGVSFEGLPETAAQRKVGPDGKPHPVLARLLLDRTAVAAGTTARIGLHLTQDEGWHTYWKSPGEIGKPTEIAWQAPHGIAVSDHEYPVPQRFEQSDIVSFGYDNEVLLISEIQVPADAPMGAHTVEAEASWLVCKSICIPGSAEVALPVEVVAEAAQGAPSAYAPLFDHYEAQHPEHALDVTAFGADYSLSVARVPADGSFRAVFLLTSTGDAPLPTVGEAPWPTFTPIAPLDYSWALDAPPRIRALDDGRILIVVDGTAYEPEQLPENARVGGLVQLDVGGREIATEISGSLPFAPAGTAPEPVASPLITLADEHFPREGAPAVVDPEPEPEPPRPAEASVAITASTAAGAGRVSLPVGLAFGFLGGLILNVMPCVLPVLFLKLFGLVEQVDVTPRDRQIAGVAYTGGIVLSFWVLAALVIGAQLTFGTSLGWGFQFQYPEYVAALATVVFVFGLSLFGVFEIPAFGVSAATDAASQEGPAGYFMYGVFAVLLATPCSAPLLGPAIAYAFSAPPVELTAIFTMIALGLASPFLLVAFVPAVFQYLPKPGDWMETIKQFLGFTLIATTLWLVDVLANQIGSERTTGFMVFLLAASVGAWLFGRFGGLAASVGRQLLAGGIALLIAAGTGVAWLDFTMADDDCVEDSVDEELAFDEEIPWRAFTEERVTELAGTTLFIDFTADWCLTCKVNEQTVLETSSVRAAMAEHGVIPLKADWTRRDETIGNWLRRFERAGVPMYLVIPGDRSRQPILLPETITPGMVISAIQDAS